MQLKRVFFAAVVVTAAIFTSGCAVNRATASVDKTADLGALKRLHVVKVQEDDRGIEKLIATRLGEMGYTATSSTEKRADVDANVTYIDKWYWDLTMYMIELTIAVRDPKTDFPLATGNSLHTSLTRKSPTEMVAEVTTNIFKDVKK